MAVENAKVIEYDSLQDSLALVDNDNTSNSNNTTNTKEDDRLLQAWRASRQKALEKLETTLLDDNNVSMVILDDNFYLRSMRKQVYQVCQRQAAAAAALAQKIYFGIVYVNTPLDVCLQRNKNRAKCRQVPEDVIVRMHQRFEPPNDDDDKQATWEAADCTLTLDGSRSVVSALLPEVKQFIAALASTTRPVQPPLDPELERQRLARERQQTRESWWHRADQQLRLCVQAVAKIQPRSAGKANKIRKQVYQSLKEEKQQQQQAGPENEQHELSTLIHSFFDAVTESWDENDTAQLRREIFQSKMC